MNVERVIGRLALVFLAVWLPDVLGSSIACAAFPPTRHFCVTDYGAVGDGETIDTAALQNVIDRCAEVGGGIVSFPAGTYLTGTLFLRSRITCHLEAGAILLGSTDLRDYPAQTPEFRSYTDVNYVDKSLLYAENLRDIAIVGRGTIDGQGEADAYRKKPYKERPYLIRMIECQNVTVKDITLRDSPMWVQHYLACVNVNIDGITVHSIVNQNNDGIDIDCCDRVRISNCDIVSGDDAIVLKSTAPRPCQRVAISNCTISSHCNALKCGTESTGGFKDIAISNCTVYDTRLGGLALELVDGGILDRVSVSNITMTNTGGAIFIRLGNRARPYLVKGPGGSVGSFDLEPDTVPPAVGSLRNVVISNITAAGVDGFGCAIAGLPNHPLENITLQNIRITYAGGGDEGLVDLVPPELEDRYPEYRMFGKLPAYGFYCRHGQNIRFDNVYLDYEQPEYRPAIVCDDVDGLRLEGVDAKPPLAGNTIRLVDVKRVRGDTVVKKQQLRTGTR